MADVVLSISSVRWGAHAMGVSWWVVLVGGIIVGQVTTLLHVAYWLGYSFVDPRLEEVVRRAVFVAIQDSLEQFTTSPPSPLPVPWTPALSGGGGTIVWVVLSVCLTISVLTCGICCFPCHRRSDHKSLESGSPDSSPLSLETLARNQVAAIRLRRHGIDQSVRIGSV